MEIINTKTVNRVFCFSLLVFSISIIFVVSKYVGLIHFIGKIIKSLLPVFIAIFVSFMLEPLIGFLLKKDIKRKYCVLLVYISLILIGGLILYLTIPSLIEQINVFVNNVPVYFELIIKFIDKIGINIDTNNLANLVSDIFIGATKGIINYIGSSISALFDIVLGISGAIFLSFDFPEFRKGVKKFIPLKIKEPVIFYFKNFLPIVHKYFMGILIDSFLIFIISIVGFSIIDLDYILVVSLFITITNLIPIIGPYIGGIPAAIIGFSVSPFMGISAIVVVIIIQIIESNFMQPLILRNTIKLHPLEGILGISLFGTLFGVIGMILSPILVVAVKLLFLPYKERRDENLSEGKTFA